MPEADVIEAPRWEWHCPSCGRAYQRNHGECPEDGTELASTEVSLPFLWLG